LVPQLVADLEEGDGGGDAGDVGERADGREVRGGDLGGDGVHGRGVGDVERKAGGGDAEVGGELAGEGAGALPVEVEDRDGPALAGEAGGGGAADRARSCAPGDDGGPGGLRAGVLHVHLCTPLTAAWAGRWGPGWIDGKPMGAPVVRQLEETAESLSRMRRPSSQRGSPLEIGRTTCSARDALVSSLPHKGQLVDQSKRVRCGR